MTILQILVAKPKLWKNLYFYRQYIFNKKITFFLLKSGKMLLAVPKNGEFYKKFNNKKIQHSIMFCLLPGSFAKLLQ